MTKAGSFYYDDDVPLNVQIDHFDVAFLYASCCRYRDAIVDGENILP